MTKKQPVSLTLEELCREVASHLSTHQLLDAQSDGRVSSAPDARTIRYYTTLGLLDRPMRVGREVRYGRRHVLQLLAIKALQGASLPLGEIQARLYGRSNAELEAILAAVAGEQSHRQEPMHMIHWREITIEPGLKIMAEEGWSPEMDLASLEKRMRAALAALNTASRVGNGGSK
jgi:DNA-binding transcriptional MerR regulator